MKRSRSIRLVLIGGVTAGALAGCEPGSHPPPVSSASVYTNNYYVRGVGYYHAPFRAFFQIPYNFFEPKSQKYFYGGQWGTSPHQSITNISPPTAEVARDAEAHRTDIPRSGFGSSSRTHSVWS